MDIRGFFAKPPGAAKKEAAEKAAAEPIDLDVASSPAPAAKKEDKKKRKAGAEWDRLRTEAKKKAKEDIKEEQRLYQEHITRKEAQAENRAKAQAEAKAKSASSSGP